MQAIKMNSTYIMNTYANSADSEALKTIICLFEAANEYERAALEITRLSERIRESLDSISGGREPFYPLVETSHELTGAIAKQDAAKKLFETIANLNAFTIEV
ncbi:MAG: hypothetical protein IT328_20085 [Caldilineaceae bacterium]|nr:hypothetical protein [Caldilineaceae bacterium]